MKYIGMLALLVVALLAGTSSLFVIGQAVMFAVNEGSQPDMCLADDGTYEDCSADRELLNRQKLQNDMTVGGFVAVISLVFLFGASIVTGLEKVEAHLNEIKEASILNAQFNQELLEIFKRRANK